ncbi:MAG: 30S ribosomal protein S12 methylthiotransferase RimO [Treponema sp.]|nr:30S ribosomal protein S12 methylthiotransferase RimO [Treponema sp.]
MRYYLDAFGCVKNQVDAEVMMNELNVAGWAATENAEDADLIIVNSCGFIESAKRESIEAVVAWKHNFPEKKVLLAGCLSQRYADSLLDDFAEADILLGNADLSKILQAASSAMSGERAAIKPDIDVTGKIDFAYADGERPLLSLPGSAYVKITEGCNNHCSFCAIPGIRGPLRSRSIESVVEECKTLLNRGIKELCLIGQDLGAYGIDGAAGAFPSGQCRLPELLEALSVLDGQFWVRMLYIHPDHFPLSVLEICKKDPRILPYFDIPFQHGSAKIIKAMNRQGSPEIYLALIDTIRKALPDAVIRSTFLVGFPGETDDDFQDLLDFQEKAQLDWLGVFTYSREDDTPAFTMKPKVAKALAVKRKTLIEENQIYISEQRLETFKGKTIQVLVEEKIVNEDGLYLARAASQAPEVDGAVVLTSDNEIEVGTFVRAVVIARSGFDLSSVHQNG